MRPVFFAKSQKCPECGAKLMSDADAEEHSKGNHLREAVRKIAGSRKKGKKDGEGEEDS